MQWKHERDHLFVHRGEGRDDEALAPGARGHMATYARVIARSCVSPGVQVVLTPATLWPHQAIATGHPAPLAIDVVDLMLPTDCVVVPAERMPSPTARAAASAWGTERLLLAPAVFGHEMLAVGLAALPDGVRPDLKAVRGAGEQLAAALAAWGLGLPMGLATA